MTAPLISRRLANQTVAPRAERAIPDFKNWVRRECTKCPKDGSFCENCFGLRFTFRPPGLTAAERRERNWRWAGVAVLLGLLAAALILGGCGQDARLSGEPEFSMRDIPAKTFSHDQGYDIYEITGHGKRCYVAGFGVAKTLLWCEAEKP